MIRCFKQNDVSLAFLQKRGVIHETPFLHFISITDVLFTGFL